MYIFRTCDKCANFRLAQGLVPYGNNGQVLFYCPVRDEYRKLGACVDCEKFAFLPADYAQVYE